MKPSLASVASSRGQELRTKIKQYGLVFVQVGAAFEVLRQGLITELGGEALSARELCEIDVETLRDASVVVLTDLEDFSSNSGVGPFTLGNLRQKVTQILNESDVCLLSRVPRMAYPNVPGSSLIEDAKVHCLPTLEADEQATDVAATEGAMLPTVSHGSASCSEVFHASVVELGVSVLAALDYAIFESLAGPDFVERLAPAEIEALRGAGLVDAIDGVQKFPAPLPFSEFKESVSMALANVVHPQSELGDITARLWTIERTVRRALRQAAVIQRGRNWRESIAQGALASDVLQRARGDAYLTASGISELRDPIEWLSVEELLDVVQSKTFSGLGVKDYIWQRFRQELVPIRNRLSHMRIIRNGDKSTVAMWEARIISLQFATQTDEEAEQAVETSSNG
jgi:hypothetical protein